MKSLPLLDDRKQSHFTKFSRKRKAKKPCDRCGLSENYCICHLIPKLHLQTRIILVIHVKELKRTTNTGTLALEALSNSQLKIRGDNFNPLDLSPLLTPEYETLLLYPADHSMELNSDFLKSMTKPIQLIVPDGNWRQASKVCTRHKELELIPRVMIKSLNLAKHHLRAENSPYGMSTLEAIARALGVIENSQVEATLMELYQAKLRSTLKSRGIKFKSKS